MSLEFRKFKILCINIFIILFKAATLNPYKLQTQLDEIEYNLQKDCDLCHSGLLLLISLYLEIKFVFGYVTLTGNVIAMFPILAEDLPNLLLPAIFAQTLDYIALNFSEVLLGYFTIKLVTNAPFNMSIFSIFLTNKFFIIIFAITALNTYSDFYQELKWKSMNILSSLSLESNEEFIEKQSLE